jgi:hypothetical protein
MYGLLYPAILGTAIVLTLQHFDQREITATELSVAITAWVFFGVSFASAFKKEDEYHILPFVLDTWELFEMLVCFLFLNIAEPIPDWFRPYARSLTGAYLTLCVAVVLQLWWRRLMGLKWYAFIDLKSILFGLLVVGALWGNSFFWLNWAITIAFTASAGLYIAAHPYGAAAPTFSFSRRAR